MFPNTRPQLAWHCEIYPGWEKEWSVLRGKECQRERHLIFCVSFCIWDLGFTFLFKFMLIKQGKLCSKTVTVGHDLVLGQNVVCSCGMQYAVSNYNFDTAIVISGRNVWNIFLNHLGVKIRTSPICGLRQHFKGGEKLCSHFFWRSLDLAKSDWRSLGYPIPALSGESGKLLIRSKVHAWMLYWVRALNFRN